MMDERQKARDYADLHDEAERLRDELDKIEDELADRWGEMGATGRDYARRLLEVK